MLLSEKIAAQRKNAGFSQEELANKIGVSRQAVSKWESGTSTPDLEKILALADLYEVTVDYLLREDQEEYVPLQPLDVTSTLKDAPSQQELQGNYVMTKAVPVDTNLAQTFINASQKQATSLGISFALCVLSSAPLILLKSLAADGRIGLTSNQAAGVGITLLVLFVAAAVTLLIKDNQSMKPYKKLKTQPLITTDDVRVLAEQAKQDYDTTHTNMMIAGVVFCILSCVPLIFIGTFYRNSLEQSSTLFGILVCALLCLVALGIYFFINTSTVWESFQILLEEEAYTRENKNAASQFVTQYWTCVTAVYFLVSLITFNWEITWVIWPIASLVYLAMCKVLKRKILNSKNTEDK